MVRDKVAASDFCCGPLQISLRSLDADLHGKITETLALYDFAWPAPLRPIKIFARRSRDQTPEANGGFLRCARILVDAVPGGLIASTTSGARATAAFDDAGETWHITVPGSLIENGRLLEIEDVLSLVLTTGWRREGWTPIHAAGVVKGKACVVVCAPTGGGKTTLSAALVRRGWQVLGDDKLLLRLQTNRPAIAALLHTFNLHPKTREWFPEVGDLEELPRYSAFTEKRKVKITSIWSHSATETAEPTVLISLQRSIDVPGPVIAPLSQHEVFATLLRQTVIPSDREVARTIVSTIAGVTAHLRGLRVEVPTDAYRDSEFLSALERAIESQ